MGYVGVGVVLVDGSEEDFAGAIEEEDGLFSMDEAVGCCLVGLGVDGVAVDGAVCLGVEEGVGCLGYGLIGFSCTTAKGCEEEGE